MMKVRHISFSVMLALGGLVVFPTALFLMGLLHRFLLGGRDIRTEPLLLVLLGLASLFLAFILTSVGFFAFLASAEAIRRHFLCAASSETQIRPPLAGTERVAREWFNKAIPLLHSEHHEAALHCLRAARTVAMGGPQQEMKQDLQRLCEERLKAGVSDLSMGLIDEASIHAQVALAASDTMIEPIALLIACEALRANAASCREIVQTAQKAGHSPEAVAKLVTRYIAQIPPKIWESLPFHPASAACQGAGIEVCRKFDVPSSIIPFLVPLLSRASITQHRDSFELLCCGFDASFLDEFLVLFKYNYLATMSGGQAVEVVRKAYWHDKTRERRVSPPPWEGVDGYFHRLEEVLFTTNVIGFARPTASGRLNT